MRRAVHVVCSLVVGMLLAAPMLLGPAAPWALRAVGGEPEHHCACGMMRGKCACPECAEQQSARAQAKAHSPRPTLRSTCDDDTPPMPNAAPLPLATVPVAVALAGAPAIVPSPLSSRERAPPRGRDTPPTPPPRRDA